MKVKLYKSDLEKMIAVLTAIDADKTTQFELEIDDTSGIGTVGTLHIPTAINSLPGTFSYEIWGSETW